MKTYQINRLLVVAAVAFLPIACGTSSPTGPDFAADATMSALRTEPTTPEAPQAPSPEQVPNPVPSPKPSPKPTPTPDPTSVDTVPSAPVPSEPTETTEPTKPVDRGNTRPVAPQPEPSADVNEPEADTAGPAAPGVETGRTVPTTRPAGNPGDTGSVPVPPVVKCNAYSLEILNVTTFAPTNGLALEAVLKGKDGLAITDSSCETLLWAAEGSSSSTRVVITHGSNSRYVTVTGLVTGTYKIGVTAPNHVTTSVSISVQ